MVDLEYLLDCYAMPQRYMLGVQEFAELQEELQVGNDSSAPETDEES